jgi:hypothetical protein
VVRCQSPESNRSEISDEEDELFQGLSKRDQETFGKDILDTGANAGMGSVRALEILYFLRRGTGMKVDIRHFASFRVASGDREQTSSITDVELYHDGVSTPLQLHGLESTNYVSILIGSDWAKANHIVIDLPLRRYFSRVTGKFYKLDETSNGLPIIDLVNPYLKGVVVNPNGHGYIHHGYTMSTPVANPPAEEVDPSTE